MRPRRGVGDRAGAPRPRGRDRADLEVGCEGRALARPVAHDTRRRDDQERRERRIVGTGRLHHGDGLHRLAQPHVVGEDAAEPLGAQEVEPVEPRTLIVPEGGSQPHRGIDPGEGRLIGQTAHAQPPLGLLDGEHAELGQVVPQPHVVAVDRELVARPVGEGAGLVDDGAEAVELGAVEPDVLAIAQEEHPVAERQGGVEGGEVDLDLSHGHPGVQVEPVAAVVGAGAQLHHGDLGRGAVVGIVAAHLHADGLEGPQTRHHLPHEQCRRRGRHRSRRRGPRRERRRDVDAHLFGEGGDRAPHRTLVLIVAAALRRRAVPARGERRGGVTMLHGHLEHGTRRGRNIDGAPRRDHRSVELEPREVLAQERLGPALVDGERARAGEESADRSRRGCRQPHEGDALVVAVAVGDERHGHGGVSHHPGGQRGRLVVDALHRPANVQRRAAAVQRHRCGHGLFDDADRVMDAGTRYERDPRRDDGLELQPQGVRGHGGEGHPLVGQIRAGAEAPQPPQAVESGTRPRLGRERRQGRPAGPTLDPRAASAPHPRSRAERERRSVAAPAAAADGEEEAEVEGGFVADDRGGGEQFVERALPLGAGRAARRDEAVEQHQRRRARVLALGSASARAPPGEAGQVVGDAELEVFVPRRSEGLRRDHEDTGDGSCVADLDRAVDEQAVGARHRGRREHLAGDAECFGIQPHSSIVVGGTDTPTRHRIPVEEIAPGEEPGKVTLEG